MGPGNSKQQSGSDEPENPRHHDVDADQVDATIDEGTHESTQSQAQRIGHFEILSVLGKGAFGAVYHAKDPVLEREVAIKVPHASRIATVEMRQRFLREARAAAALRHPHICPVYEVGEEHDTPYIVMAFIKGQELSAVLKRRGHLTDRQAAVMIRRLALALEFAHQQGIVHRDLKPDNIMIDQERKEPVIMDFGLARVERGDESALTQEGQLMGTPVYMPPEQARGDLAQIGPASDIYSLGVILYELLCGRRPHEGSLAEVLSKVLNVDPEPPSAIQKDIDPGLESICLKAIAREIDGRFTSMAQFADELTAFLKADGGYQSEPAIPVLDAAKNSHAGGETVLASGAETTESGTPPRLTLKDLCARHAVKIGAAAIVVVLVAVLAGPWTGGTPDISGPPVPPVDARPQTNRLQEFIGNSESLVGVGLSPDNQWIVAATGRGTVRAWHREHAEPRLDKKVARFIKRGMLFTHDSRSVVVHNAFSVLQISIPEGEVTNHLAKKRGQSCPTYSTISRSGIVYVNRIVQGATVISKREASTEITTTWIAKGGECMPWSAVLPESEMFLGVHKEGGVHFWNCEGQFRSEKDSELTSDELTIVSGHDSLPTCLAWSTDELVAATADCHGHVILWDVPNRKELRRLEPHSSTIHSMALSPDGTRLLTGCGNVAREATRDDLQDDFTIRLWDVGTGRLLAIVGTHRDTVSALSFGGDSTEAVSCSGDNSVCLWKISEPSASSVEK